MIRDVAAKLLLIPLLGVAIALITGAVPAANEAFATSVLAVFFWIVITFLLWQGVVLITAFIRRQATLARRTAGKIFLLLLGSVLLALLLTSSAISLWNKLFQNPISSKNNSGYAFIYLAIAPVISLVYEILFLKKEQELDSKIVTQLDYERQSAELQALTNELEPHFIFNALNVLSPLITIDAAKAQVFTIKLAQVYRYLLHNKDRDLITLPEELHFIEDYFFLLQIRHQNKLRLHLDFHEPAIATIMILPFSLQVLVENAMKHNQLSEEKPLTVSIRLAPPFIEVRNSVFAKPYMPSSTHVGLKNLSARYKLFCHKDIIVHETKDSFLVKLPLIKTTV